MKEKRIVSELQLNSELLLGIVCTVCTCGSKQAIAHALV
jgi:hypothetical protein